MTYVMVDVETDGPIPGDYSMISFGAVIVESGLQNSFYGKLRPISDKWIPEALAISGHTREDTLMFDDPTMVMAAFERWLHESAGDRPQFIADNNGFDWMFIAWYFHHFLQRYPFGYSSTNLGSLYKGMRTSEPSKANFSSYSVVTRLSGTIRYQNGLIRNRKRTATLQNRYFPFRPRCRHSG